LANDDAVALYAGGWALVQVAGSAEEGIAAIDRALTLNPNMTSAWLFLDTAMDFERLVYRNE
jgi:hypothetical protein